MCLQKQELDRPTTLISTFDICGRHLLAFIKGWGGKTNRSPPTRVTMNGAKARSDAPVAENVSGGTAAPPRDRKPGGGVLKRLKSRRSQVDSRPVTEEDLRGQSGHIAPEDVLGLRVATRGLVVRVS